MKKHSILFFVFFCLPVLVWAQNAADILVFFVEGDVKINRHKITLPCKRADKILAADIIDIKTGSVSLVDRNLKRVTLEKKGKYSYRQIADQFKMANASLSNKFLVQVLDKMTHHSESVSKAGGVVRGTRNASLPIDSAVILTEAIRFTFTNMGKQALTFFILDEEHHVLFSKKTTGNRLAVKKENAAWWKPGTYFWEAAAPGKDGTAENIFFIPADEERLRLLSEYNDLKKSFASYPAKVRKQLMDEVLTQYRWVVK